MPLGLKKLSSSTHMVDTALSTYLGRLKLKNRLLLNNWFRS